MPRPRSSTSRWTCGHAPAPAAKRSANAPPVFVNGVHIAETAIAAEAQNHAAATGQEARAAAARALVIRELLLQRARVLGLEPMPLSDAQGRSETAEEALVRQVLEGEVEAIGELVEQARGRDFWQSPMLFWHLIVRALSAGAAMFILIGALELVTPYQFVSPPMFFWLVNILVISILAGFALTCGELFIKHGSEESLRAGSLLVSGRLGKAFWPLVVGAGVILPAVLILWQPGATIVSAAAAAAALFGLWIYEHIWIKAGQAMPLS